MWLDLPVVTSTAMIEQNGVCFGGGHAEEITLSNCFVIGASQDMFYISSYVNVIKFSILSLEDIVRWQMKLMQMLPELYCISYLVAAVSLQCLWSMLMALVDIYAILVKRSLRNCRVVSLFTIGDGVREMHPWPITSTTSNILSWYCY